MADVQLEDLIASYPDPDRVSNIQTVVGEKQEFRDLIPRLGDAAPRVPGEFFKHQDLVARMSRFWDVQLLMHRTGTGKTGAEVATAELHRRLHERGESPINRCNVLYPSPNMGDVWKQDIVCRYTSGTYLPERLATEGAPRKTAITRALGVFYTFMTYRQFASQLTKRNLSDEQIVREFSHSIWVCDEIHVLSAPPVTEDDQEVDMEAYTELQGAYKQLHRIFHLIQGSKVLLTTATPMTNSVDEIAAVMNLILPLSMQLPEDKLNGVPYSAVTLEQMAPYFKGRVSYVRESETGVKVRFEGVQMDNYEVDKVSVASRMRVHRSQMDPFQDKTYRSIKRGQTRFHHPQRQSSNFIFPDGSYGNTAFSNYVEKNGPDNYSMTKELHNSLTTQRRPDMDKLRKFSCKFAEIIRLTISEKGNQYVYTEFLRVGAILLGLCFQLFGVQKFAYDQSVFPSGGESDDYCGGGRVDRAKQGPRGRKVSIPLSDGSPKRPWRYALLTSDTSKLRYTTILETFNSWENRNGELIKVLIGTPIITVGYSFRNVLGIHLVSPSWNQSSTYQATSRAIRATSHNDLLESTPQVAVKIYQHEAAALEGVSVDTQMYHVSETKDMEIKKMERIMKQCCTDYYINHARNVRDSDVINSPECDYTACNYTAIDPPPTRVDSTTYDVLYAEGGVVRAVRAITNNIFPQSFFKTWDDLERELHLPRRFILMAIEKIIREKTLLHDRFGFGCYLRTDGDILLLTREYPLGLTAQQRGTIIYTQTLLGIQQVKLSTVTLALQQPKQDIIISLLDVPQPNLLDLLRSLNINNRAVVLERAIFRQLILKQNAPNDLGILDAYKFFVFELSEQTGALEAIRKSLLDRGTKKGRKPGKALRVKTQRVNPKRKYEKSILEIGGPLMYIHTLYGQSFDRVSYAVTSQYTKAEGRVRVCKPWEERGWRDLNPNEVLAYNQVLQILILEKLEPYSKHPIYGTVLADGKFRVRDRNTEPKKAKNDAKLIKRGKDCTTWKHPSLVDLLWEINASLTEAEYKPTLAPRFQVGPSVEAMSRKELIAYLVKMEVRGSASALGRWDDERLIFYSLFMRSGWTKGRFCEEIKKNLEKLGLVLHLG